MSMSYHGNTLTANGRLTREPKKTVNNRGQAFIFFDLACSVGFKGQTNFLRGFLIQGILKADQSFDNTNVESFEKNVKKGALITVDAHLESYEKKNATDPKDKWVENKVVDGFRVLSLPSSNESAGEETSSTEEHTNSSHDPLDDL